MLSHAVENKLSRRHFCVAGVGLDLRGEGTLLRPLEARLHAPASVDWPIESSVEFEFRLGDLEDIPRPTGNLRPVYESDHGEVLYAVEQDVLYISSHDRLRAVCYPTRGKTRVVAHRPRPGDIWLLSHPLLTLPLLEMFKRRGLFGIHAAGLARTGRALMIAGTSGAGKTTLAIALARAGFEFMGDDMLFLAMNEEGIRIHPFPEEIDVTATTAGFFPELRPLVARARPPGWPKWSFRPERFYSVLADGTATPGALVFPRVTGAATSHVEQMSAAEALQMLVPDVLLTHPAACKAHLAALARLTDAVPSYRMSTGTDVGSLPDLVGRLLA